MGVFEKNQLPVLAINIVITLAIQSVVIKVGLL